MTTGAPPVAAPVSVGGGSLSLPSLTAAWPELLSKLKGLARAIYAPGHFVAVDGARLRFAVPSTTPLHRAEEHRPAVEAALSAYFGQQVAIAVTREDAGGSGGAGPAGGPSGNSDAGPRHEPEESIDLNDLVDAPPEAVVNPIDRLVQAFPGATVVNEPD